MQVGPAPIEPQVQRPLRETEVPQYPQMESVVSGAIERQCSGYERELGLIRGKLDALLNAMDGPSHGSSASTIQAHGVQRYEECPSALSRLPTAHHLCVVCGDTTDVTPQT